MIQWGKRFSFERRGGRRITICLYWHFVKEFSCELLAAGHPYVRKRMFFLIESHTWFYTMMYTHPRISIFGVLELGRQPEVGAQKKNWNFFQNILKKWWKTYSNTYQHHHRVIWYQGLRIWHRHVRTTITFSYRDHFTFPTF